MAMHAGMGLSKVLFLIGAGYTGTVMMKNGKLLDILGELQMLLKGMEGSDTENSALVSQIERLAREIQLMATSRPITVVSGGGSIQGGNLSSLIIPAASLGAVGYGYMWWKGLCFSGLAYVTKKNMANAVANMTALMEQLFDALSATKRHLTQRIQNLDGKLDEQKEISKDIMNELANARGGVSNLGYDVNQLQQFICGLSDKLDAIKAQQIFVVDGVMYLCQFVQGKGGKVPEFLQSATNTSGKKYLGFTENTSLKGLQHITDVIESGNFEKDTNSTTHTKLIAI